MNRIDSKQSIWKLAFIVFAVFAAAAPVSLAQTLTTLASFDDTDGYQPYVAVVQGVDGNFYGTTAFGGTHGAGAVFRVTPSGNLSTLYDFTGGDDGEYPYARSRSVSMATSMAQLQGAAPTNSMAQSSKSRPPAP
jgi:uncharacterized repeat protein (TIGR03803 family)